MSILKWLCGSPPKFVVVDFGKHAQPYIFSHARPQWLWKLMQQCRANYPTSGTALAELECYCQKFAELERQHRNYANSLENDLIQVREIIDKEYLEVARCG